MFIAIIRAFVAFLVFIDSRDIAISGYGNR